MSRSVRALTIPVNRPHVVIIGGGFAGLAAAKQLVNKPVRVTIVDRNNFHTFLPLLYQVATGGLEPADIAYPLRAIFGHAKNISFRHATVQRVDRPSRTVVTDNDDVISYDYLIVATGARATFFNVLGAEQYALPLYTLLDARRLRNRLLTELERAEIRGVTNTSPLHFVIVGGGPTGVESAGAIVELLDISRHRDGLHLNSEHTRVTLLDQADRLLTSFPKSASVYARTALHKIGVEVRLNCTVVEIGKHSLRLRNGEVIEATAIVWATGVSVSGTVATSLNASPTPSGRVMVRNDLSLTDDSSIFIAGDAGAIVDIQSGDLCPQIAPVAIQSGRHCARQVQRDLAGLTTESFAYHDKGMMATMGRHAAVAKLPKGPIIRGVAGWFAWLGLHLFYLIGFRNRLRVLINWTWRYFDWPSGPRLIVGDEPEPPQMKPG